MRTITNYIYIFYKYKTCAIVNKKPPKLNLEFVLSLEDQFGTFFFYRGLKSG